MDDTPASPPSSTSRKGPGRHRSRARLRSRSLTAGEIAFIEAYLGPAQLNATEAARLAGFEGDATQLAKTGSRILRRPQVNRAIGRHLQKRVATPGEILGELSDIAMSDWRDHLRIKYGRDGEVLDAQLRLADKVKALELLGKASGALQDPLQRVVERLLRKELQLLEETRARLAQRGGDQQDGEQQDVVEAQVVPQLPAAPSSPEGPAPAVEVEGPGQGVDRSAAERVARLLGAPGRRGGPSSL